MRPHDDRGWTARGGVTLLEVSIVIAIIAVLAAILVPVLQKSTGQAKEAAAKALIEKIKIGLAKRLEWYESASASTAYEAAFPEAFTDATPAIAPADPAKHNAVEQSANPNYRLNTERAECLYWMLLGPGAQGSARMSRDDFSADEVRDTDGDGLPEFVDPWGTPIRFMRSPSTSPPATKLREPGFPARVPMIICAGPDMEFGLDWANRAHYNPHNGYAHDNITTP